MAPTFKWWSAVVVGLALIAGQAPAQVPQILEITPSEGAPGSVISISGGNFSPIPSDNKVRFGCVLGMVVEASPTLLKVQVPPSASSGPISVTVAGLTTYSATPYVVTFPSSGLIDLSSFSAEIEVPFLGGTPKLLQKGACDIDDDGRIDILFNGVSDMRIARNISTASEVLFEVPELSLQQAGIVADLDGDGKVDLFGGTVVHRNTSSPGSISFEQSDLQEPILWGVPSDLNGDGRLDFCDFGRVRQYGLPVRSYVRVQLNNSSPGIVTMSPPQTVFECTGTSIWNMVYGNLTDDNLPDLLLWMVDESSYPETFGFYLCVNSSTDGQVSFAPPVMISLDADRWDVEHLNLTIDDIDSDGRNDLVLWGEWWSGAIGVALNQSTPGNPGFAPFVRAEYYWGPQIMSRPDVDGDGRRDYALFSIDGVRVIKNTSTLNGVSFGPGIRFAFSQYPAGMAEDFNGDGKPDLVYDEEEWGGGRNKGFLRLNAMGALFGDISGMVRVNGSGLAEVAVKVLDPVSGTPVPTISPTVTDAAGRFFFEDVAVGTYDVMIVDPLGYSVDGNPKGVTVLPDATVTVDFALDPAVHKNNARGAGYWKYQFDAYINGRISPQESEAALDSYLELVQERYTPHFSLFAGMTTFPQWSAMLTLAKGAPAISYARQQIAALVLNIVSLKIAQYEPVTGDGRTAGNVLTYASELATDGDASNDAVAGDLAKSVNEQKMIKSGEVPPRNKLYKKNTEGSELTSQRPSAFSLRESYPNPFNPSTTIRYELPKAVGVRLSVIDVHGREVSVLVDERREAGSYEVRFDASGLASGLYLCRLQAGDFVQTRKLLLVK